MDIKLELTGEQINQEIIKAITESLIGEQLQKAIEKELKNWQQSYNNPLEQIVAIEIRRIIENLLRNKYSEVLETAIKALLTEELVGNIASAAFKNLMTELDKRRY